MRLYKCAIFCAILALSILEPITARKTFAGGSSKHSYPKSGGLSGGGSHTYPSNGGLSGGGRGGYPPSSGSNHGYPSGGGLSGGGSRYPSQGGQYPSSGGQYPGGSHAHPSSGHSYPSSGGGLSGNNNRGTAGSTTNIHHHYHYSPPQSINYAPTRGAPAMSYPVYHGTPPTYVYQYKDSGSKYGTLLAGLALLNLGTLGVATYAAVHSSNGNSGSSYKTQPGEVCKFGLKKGSDYEETRIDCQLISSFILQAQAEQAKTQGGQITNTTTTVVNQTIVNNGNPGDQSVTKQIYEKLPNGTFVPANETVTKTLYEMLPNGTLVPVPQTVPKVLYEMLANGTLVPFSNTDSNLANPSANNTMTSSVVTTTTTVTNALDVKGKPVEVTPDMECYVIRTSPASNMRKAVPCGLLQTYADTSIKKNSASRSIPTFTILTLIFAAFVVS